jgi:hypothetical protein
MMSTIFTRVFGNSPDCWLNVQRQSDLWEAMHSPKERERIERPRLVGAGRMTCVAVILSPPSAGAPLFSPRHAAGGFGAKPDSCLRKRPPRFWLHVPQ